MGAQETGHRKVTQGTNLNWQDVERLKTDRSGACMSATASKIVALHGTAGITAAERQEAEAVFRTMAEDAKVAVRHALSEVLKSYRDAPHDVMRKLANDIDEIAVPVISVSPVLTDEDLIDIVQSRRASCQVAVAGRAKVSGPVADMVARVADSRAVETLAANEGARLAENTCHAMIERFSAAPKVTASLVRRTELPVSVAERLVEFVSDSLKSELVARHELSDDVAADLIERSRERATLDISDRASGGAGVGVLVARLADKGRLTSTIMLRALYSGDFDFFETGLARLAGVGVSAVHRLLKDGGEAGIRGIWIKAGMPDACVKYVLASLELAGELEYTGRRDDRQHYRTLLAERLLSKFGDGFDAENMDYLLDRGLPAEAA